MKPDALAVRGHCDRCFQPLGAGSPSLFTRQILCTTCLGQERRTLSLLRGAAGRQKPDPAPRL